MTQWRSRGNSTVITGGASGIGLAAAQRLVADGMNVLVADKNEEALGAAAELLRASAPSGVQVVAHACDVTELVQVEAMRDAAFEQLGAVHCLMNNAGASIITCCVPITRPPAKWIRSESNGGPTT